VADIEKSLIMISDFGFRISDFPPPARQPVPETTQNSKPKTENSAAAEEE
jgi:hypothetical protein